MPKPVIRKSAKKAEKKPVTKKAPKRAGSYVF